ncbi:hypothetical protein [Clostridium estertheticum]|uniref:hypothetical protein n=1 Tax=Clostridium estertheticum TaxID=238834 RepID=UPI001CF24F9E|nr:hypothetical protein [Clostridium estertheticum]MCB2354478.1 hypothetical protein [Clostridium estertheticum]WAG42409.1 hypothetical protein LL065_06955 [Clostridium estertheticum]
MKKQNVPAIKDYKGMNIANNLIYFKESYQREVNVEKKAKLKNRLDKLKIELENYKANKAN